MAYKQILVMLMSAWLVAAQRGSFAGSKPIGFPDVTTTPDPLGNRFGEDLPLPIEANGDRALVERISKYPIDQQPFWYINWKATEEKRKNPQTYPQRESSFSGTFQNAGGNSGQAPQANQGANSDGLTSKFGSTNDANANSFNNDRPKQHNYRYVRLD